jgi:hypothetical protein
VVIFIAELAKAKLEFCLAMVNEKFPVALLKKLLACSEAAIVTLPAL